MLWFRRDEFKRFGGFVSDASIRDTFDFSSLMCFSLPIPSLSIQKNIAEISSAMKIRQKIIASLKDKIFNICPILIKGSLEYERDQR
jgi:type I restriction enzyme S subunit